MRHLATLSLAFSLLAAQAQRLSISDLLSVTNCQDTACIGDFAEPKGLCLMGGEEEDGWMWCPCDFDPGDTPPFNRPEVCLGFFGYPRSNYHYYQIGTWDTTYATTLTEELDRLGFKVLKPHPEGQIYQSSAYPGLELHRKEKRASSIVHKRKGDPKSRFNKPLEDLPGDEAERYREQGYDSYDLIPELLWLFRVVVQK